MAKVVGNWTSHRYEYKLNGCTGEDPKKEEVMEGKAAPLNKEKEEQKGAVKPAAKDRPAEVMSCNESEVTAGGSMLQQSYIILVCVCVCGLGTWPEKDQAQSRGEAV